MNGTSKIVSALSMAALLVMSSAHAAVTNNDGTINFTGEIIAAACTVDIGANNTMTVDMGKVNKSVFTGAGSYASATEFDLKVKDCPETGVNGISVKFDGTAYNGDPSILALTSDSGVATGVGIELLDNAQKPISLFTASDAYPLPASQTTLTMPMFARYKQVDADVVAGKANSTVQFTLNYN
ncbi:TPA: fimbrial protein [Enterobacter ludwigii]